MNIAQQRLHSQRIASAPFGKPEEVVHWLAAVQAQDYAGAKWSLGLRLERATDADLDQAFNEGVILRTHLLRPTWHFVTPADIRWLLGLTAGRVHAANAHMYRKLGLDGALLQRGNNALAKSLQGGRHLTRGELRAQLQKAGLDAEGGMRMGYILMHAELEGIVCSGPRRGRQFTYALLDERVPPGQALAKEEALAELASRYFASRGPATVQDFAKWSGLTVADARAGLESVKDRFVHVEADGQSQWVSGEGGETGKSPRAFLLSVYDEYISGYKDRRAMAEPEVAAGLAVLGNDLTHIIVVDGQVTGSWKRRILKDCVLIELNPFVPLGEAEESAVSEAAGRYGAFLELAVELV